MSVQTFASLPLRSLVPLVAFCFTLAVSFPSAGIASMTVEEEQEMWVFQILQNFQRDYIDQYSRVFPKNTFRDVNLTNNKERMNE